MLSYNGSVEPKKRGDDSVQNCLLSKRKKFLPGLMKITASHQKICCLLCSTHVQSTKLIYLIKIVSRDFAVKIFLIKMKLKRFTNLFVV